MTSNFTRVALMAGVLTLGLTAAASAQTPPPHDHDAPQVERRVVVMGGPGGPGMHGPGMGGMPGMHGPMDPEKHAQHMRDILQLRPDQEGALKAFLAAMTPPAPPAEGAGPPKPMDMPKTTPERLAMAEKMMAEHQAMFKKHNDAIRAFYGQLTPSQKTAFDALHQGMGPMHGPGMRMGRMGGMGGPGMERRVRVMHPGGPGAAGAPGGGVFIIDGQDNDEGFEIEVDGDDDDGQ